MRATNEALDDIRHHGTVTYPEECCGLLLGRRIDKVNEIIAARPVQNRNENRRVDRYVIDPRDFHAIDRVARGEGLDIVGIYHSHPDHPALPSQTDLEQATFSGYTYVIVSIRSGQPTDLTAWTLAPDRSRFLPEEIHPLRSSEFHHAKTT